MATQPRKKTWDYNAKERSTDKFGAAAYLLCEYITALYNKYAVTPRARAVVIVAVLSR